MLRLTPSSLLLIWAPILGMVTGVTLVLNPVTYHWAVRSFQNAREYSFVEMATVVCFLICAAGAACLTYLHRPQKGEWLPTLAFSFLTVVAFVVAMEEVQWGQPILAYEIPSVIAQNNIQREMTLHNLDGMHCHAAKLYLLFCAAGFMLFLPRLWPLPKQVLVELRPHRDLRSILWLVLIVTISMMLVISSFGNVWAPMKPTRWTQEILELYIAYWSAAYVVIKCAEMHKISSQFEEIKPASSK